jgi:hypothetical protein
MPLPPGGSREESSPAGHSFDGAERVLDSASRDPHQARIGADARLQAVERRLIEESMDRPLRSGRAPRFQDARLAGRRPAADRSIPRVLA